MDHSTDTPLPIDIRMMSVLTRFLYFVFSSILIALLIFWLIQRSFFEIQSMEFQGDLQHQNDIQFRYHLNQEILENDALEAGLFFISLEKLQERFTDIPWVQQVQIQRVFPNRLKIKVKEHQAFALWQKMGSGFWVNRQGEIFEASHDDEQAAQLIELDGPESQVKNIKRMSDHLLPLFAAHHLPLRRLELTEQGSWRVQTQSLAKIELGRGEIEQITTRTQQFLTTLPQVTRQYKHHPLQSADLRYESAYAVRLQGVTALPPENR